MRFRTGCTSQPVLITLLACLALVIAGCSLTSDNGNCDAQGGSNPVTCTQSENGAGDSAAPTSAPGKSGQASVSSGGASDGVLLGSYNISLLPNYNVFLSSTKPRFSQFVPAGDECDSGNLCATINNGPFVANSGSTMLGIQGGSTPTYHICKNAEPAPEVPDTAETSFCIAETGLMVGVTVTSVSSTSPYSSGLHIVVWRNLS